jgi:transposase
MPWSLTKKIIRNRPYWYARICQRVDGKPRIVQTRYLGTAEDIVGARDAQRQALVPKEVTLAEFGASAALWDVAQKLRLIETVDRHVSKRDQGLSVGQYIALAALNRAIEPCSKAGLADWHNRSIVSRLIPARSGQLTSQRFWDHLRPISETQIRAIERDLCSTAIEMFGLDLRLLLFDPTNFFTFIDSFTDGATLAQRGKSKEGRASLRILGFALAATADGPVPLVHDLYPGNRHDATEFPVIVERLTERLGKFRERIEDITLVFDKGNNSKENFDQLAGTPFNFVGSLVPTHYPGLLQIPLDQFQPMAHPRLQGVLSFRCVAHAFDHWRTVVMTHNPRLYEAQRKTLEREVRKRLRKLRALKRRLETWRAGRGRGKQPTVESVQKHIGSSRDRVGEK